MLSKEAKEVVLEIDSWGANFAKLKDGKLTTFFGAHTTGEHVTLETIQENQYYSHYLKRLNL